MPMHPMWVYHFSAGLCVKCTQIKHSKHERNYLRKRTRMICSWNMLQTVNGAKTTRLKVRSEEKNNEQKQIDQFME